MTADAEALCDPVPEHNLPGNVAVFCGHMFNTGSEAEKDLAARIAEQLEKLDIAVGYGPLACGADIVIAEELLALRAKTAVTSSDAHW